MKMYLNSREVEVTETEFEFGDGAWAVDAVYVVSGDSLTDEELDQLNEKYSEQIYQDAYEHQASHAYDMYKDRMKYGE